MLPTPSDIASIWNRIECVLHHHVPDTARTLARAATDREIADLQAAIGLVLPDDFRHSLKLHNGQDDPTRCHTFIIEGLLAKTNQIAETWRMITDLDEAFRRQEADWDRHGHGEWWNRYWVPFTIGEGDCLCIDLNPQVRPGSTFGEIVCHVHDNPHEPGIAPSYGAWLERLARGLEKREFTIDEHGYLNLNIA